MQEPKGPWPAGEWRRHLTEAVTSPDELLGLLGLATGELDVDPTSPAVRRFPLRVPRSYAARMRPGDPDDPLLIQILPTAAEDSPAPGYSVDPVGELCAPPDTGLLRKYQGRCLLVVTGACGVHCRYCFRRHFPYTDTTGVRQWTAALVRIARDPSLEEVILSGGDPLTVPDDLLGELVSLVAAAPHVRRLRIHTRLPIVLPERVDEALVAWLEATRLSKVVVVHANHPNEINQEVARALRVLASVAGVTVLNQSVLLRRVNDTVESLCELSLRLFDAGALPYYLHMLDRVEGAAHFEVPEEEARRLISEVRARLPGYLVPRLVREVEGAPSKVPVE